MQYDPTLKYLSQRDPKWGDVILSGSSLRMKDYGCALTCISILTDYYGCYTEPGVLAVNPKFCINGNVSWIGLDFPTFSFRWADGNLFNTALSIIDNGLLKNYCSNASNGDRAAIIQITVTPPKGGQPYTHFLVGLWTTDDDIHVLDPWDGKSKYLFASYPYAKITEVCYFTKWDKTKHNNKQAWQGAKQPMAPLYN